jgi:hypothetical protein
MHGVLYRARRLHLRRFLPDPEKAFAFVIGFSVGVASTDH